MACCRLSVLLCSGWLAACGASEKEVRPAASAAPLDPAVGAAGGGGGAGASEGDTELENEMPGKLRPGPAPELVDGRYVFRLDELELEVEPRVGGRITRFSLGGVNVLTGPEVVEEGEGSLPNMYGSTFWTSPQSDWQWPPEVALDAAAHTASTGGAILTLASEAGATTGYAVQKRFWTDDERKLVSIEYTLQNQRATRAAAPWEITRVPKEGLVFFPSAAAAAPQSTLTAQVVDGVTWVDIAAAPATDSKLFQDGAEGWLAYAYRDLVFVKLFEDVPPAEQAAGEAEIEIFVNGSFDYVEIEQQGRYTLPPAGGSLPWRVDWILKRRPNDAAATVGSAELVRRVREWVSAVR